MNHPLYVGYLERQHATGKLRLSKPLDLVQLRPMLAELCDQQDGRPVLATELPEPHSSGSHWLGRIGGEDLYLRLRLSVPGNGPLPAPLEIGVAVREPQGLRITELATHFTGQSPAFFAALHQLAEAADAASRHGP